MIKWLNELEWHLCHFENKNIAIGFSQIVVMLLEIIKAKLESQVWLLGEFLGILLFGYNNFIAAGLPIFCMNMYKINAIT